MTETLEGMEAALAVVDWENVATVGEHDGAMKILRTGIKELKRNREAVEYYRFSLKAIQAQCGHLDPAEACRLILNGAEETLKKGEAILSGEKVPTE